MKIMEWNATFRMIQTDHSTSNCCQNWPWKTGGRALGLSRRFTTMEDEFADHLSMESRRESCEKTHKRRADG